MTNTLRNPTVLPLLAVFALAACSSGTTPAADVQQEVAQDLTVTEWAPLPDVEPDLYVPDLADLADLQPEVADVPEVDAGWTCGSETTCGWLTFPAAKTLIHTYDMPANVPPADWEFAKETIDQVRLKFVGEAGDSLGNLEFVVGAAARAGGVPVPTHVWQVLDIEPGTQATLRPSVLPKGDPTPLDLGKKNLVLLPGQLYYFSWTWTEYPLNAENAFGLSMTFDAGSGYTWPNKHAYLVIDDPAGNTQPIPPDQVRMSWDKGTTCGQAEQWITVWLPPDLTVTDVACTDSANYGPKLTLTLPTPDIKLGMLHWLWTLDSISKPAWAE